MTPIVDGLQASYPNVTFVYLNAQDGGQGERAFEALNMRGHPSYVLFNTGGNEIYRTFGVVPVEQLREELDTVS